MTRRPILLLGTLALASACSGCIVAPEHYHRQPEVVYAPGPPPPPRPYYAPPPPPPPRY